MMGCVSPETCWTSCKYGIINFDALLHLVGLFCMNSSTYSNLMTDTQPVELPWTRDWPVAETSTWQHTTFLRDTLPCSRRNSIPPFQQATGHWDRHHLIISCLQIQPVYCCQPLEYVPFFTGRHKLNYTDYYKVRVKCTLVQALRLCTGRMAH